MDLQSIVNHSGHLLGKCRSTAFRKTDWYVSIGLMLLLGQLDRTKYLARRQEFRSQLGQQRWCPGASCENHQIREVAFAALRAHTPHVKPVTSPPKQQFLDLAAYEFDASSS